MYRSYLGIFVVDVLRVANFEPIALKPVLVPRRGLVVVVVNSSQKSAARRSGRCGSLWTDEDADEGRDPANLGAAPLY